MVVPITRWPRPWRSPLRKLAPLWLVFLLVSPVRAEPASPSILIIDPSAGGAGGVFYQQAVASFRSAVNRDPVRHISIFVESLQLNRFRGASYENDMSVFLASKYKDRPISVIVAIGEAALQFTLKVQAEHWPDVPVVFTMVDPDLLPMIRLTRNVTGVTSRQRLSDNVNLARSMIPDLARIAIASDAFETLVAFRIAREEIASIRASGLEVLDLSRMRMRDLRDRVANLPPHTAIVYVSINSDGEGGVLLPYEALKLIADVANRPIFISAESQIGLGAIGGQTLVAAQVGEVAAPLVRRILNGEAASSIDISLGEVVRPIFDWRQLQRWKISEKQVPPGSEIRFRELTAWDRYKLQISLVVAAILSQAALISWLLYERRYRHLAEIRERDRIAELTYMNRVAGAGALSASIAHEVNQPLTGIVARAGAARRWLSAKRPDIDKVRTALDQIETAGHRASEIIASVRAMFKRDTQDKSQIDINELILHVMELVHVDLRKHQIETRLQLYDQLPPVLGSPVQLQQVILNLLMNAIDAMRSVPPRVLRVTSNLNGHDCVLVSIEDTGTGIDPSKLSEVFKPMFTTKAHGMGMGLSICSSIVESHGGRIWVSPAANRGSIFQFELPKH